MGDDKENNGIIFDTNERNWGDKFADNARLIGNIGYGVSLIPNPYTKIGGGAVALVGDAAANIADIINGRIGIIGGLGRTAGDAGIDLISLAYPGAKALNSKNRVIKAVANAGKDTRTWLNSGTRLQKAGRIAGLTGGAAALEYGLPGIAPSNNSDSYVNPFTGTANEISNDANDFSNPDAWGRAIKIASLPLFLATNGKWAKAEKAASKARKASKASKATSEAATEAATESSGATSGATTGTVSTSGATSGAATTAGATTGAASTAGATGVVLLIPKRKNKPATTTGTYTGFPTRGLTSGLILGRKTGGKLEILKELRK